MLLYLSTAAPYSLFDELFRKGAISGVLPAQKFNYNLICGLSLKTEVTAISVLPVGNIKTGRTCCEENGAVYICTDNKKGFRRKIHNITALRKEAERLLKKERVRYILCDAIGMSPSLTALKISKKFHIPCVAIVTDLPESKEKMNFFDRLTARWMKKYDAYVLLTEAMNEIVNPAGKPYIVMEGSCFPREEQPIKKDGKKICLYSGALWKNAGLETLTEGFIRAGIPDAELHYYGDGEYLEELKKICKSHENIKYMGCKTAAEVAVKQKEAALLINPRRSDLPFTKYSFPSKTMEYMLSGTPVLMTRLPGLPKEYEAHLYFAERETPEGFAESLTNILGKGKEELEEKGRMAKEFVLKNKSYKVQAEKIYSFLETLH